MREILWQKIGQFFENGAEAVPFRLRFISSRPEYERYFFTRYSWRAQQIEAFPDCWFYLAADQHPAPDFDKQIDRFDQLSELGWKGLPRREKLRVQSNPALWMENWACWLSWVTLTLAESEYVRTTGPDWTGLSVGAFEASALAIAVFLASEGADPIDKEIDTTAPRIDWNRAKLELRLDGELVKKYRGNIKPDRLLVLDAFQEVEWEECVDSPVPISDKAVRQQRTKDILKTLNAKQDGVRFSTNGDSICWGCP